MIYGTPKQLTPKYKCIDCVCGSLLSFVVPWTILLCLGIGMAINFIRGR